MAVPSTRREVLLVAAACVAAVSCKDEPKRRERRSSSDDDDDPSEGRESSSAKRAQPPSSSSGASSAEVKVYPPLQFLTDEPAALELAKKEQRPVLIEFFAAWCEACKLLQKNTLSDPVVVVKGGRFVAVRIDATNDEDPKVNALKEKYKVTGLPAVLLFDSTGKESKRISAFVSAEDFAKELDAIH